MNPPTTASAAALTDNELRELSLAKPRAAKVRRAASAAAVNGWLTALFAAFSALFAFSSLTGLAVTVGLAIVAVNEFRGRKRLLAFDRTAPALLGWNQLGLLAMIVIYCGWMIIAGWGEAADVMAHMQNQPVLRDSLQQLHDAPPDGQLAFVRSLIVLVYGLVIVLSLIFQGAMAWYYFSRRRYVAAYLDDTPAWVQELDRHYAGS